MLKRTTLSTLIQWSVFTAGLSTLGGCATTSNTNDNVKTALAGDEDDYRQTKETLKPSLEVPPDLISPSQNQQELSKLLRPTNESGVVEDIPVRQFNGLKVKTNLSERWIEVPLPKASAGEKSKQVAQLWKDVQSFLISLGFEISEVDKTLGVVRTKYKARIELAPIDAQGPLTRLLNSWRPEKAEGIYDRLTARVESDMQKGVVRLYFYDHVLYQKDDGDTDQWIAYPYSPELEAEALYQALVFLGVTANEAFKQIEVTQHLVTPDFAETNQDGNEQKVLQGVLIKAPFNVAWTYAKAMLYRAGWRLLKIDEARHQLWVQPPKNLSQDKGGLLDRLFSKSKSPVLPEQLLFTLKVAEEKPVQDSVQTNTLQLLEVEREEDQAGGLTDQQQVYIFKVLGFLNSQ